MRALRAFAVGILAALAVGTAAAQPAAKAAAARAVLVRGSEPVKGLPNFGRNALPGLYGEYRLERTAAPDAPVGPRIRVWMTPEALYASSAAWEPARFSGRSGYASTAADVSGAVAYRYALFDRPFSAAGRGAEPGRWSVIVGLPEVPEPSAAEYGRFLPLFLDRLAFFLSNARVSTDASFPAVLEW
jgi:hypothetical protein